MVAPPQKVMQRRMKNIRLTQAPQEHNPTMVIIRVAKFLEQALLLPLPKVSLQVGMKYGIPLDPIEQRNVTWQAYPQCCNMMMMINWMRIVTTIQQNHPKMNLQ